MASAETTGEVHIPLPRRDFLNILAGTTAVTVVGGWIVWATRPAEYPQILASGDGTAGLSPEQLAIQQRVDAAFAGNNKRDELILRLSQDLDLKTWPYLDEIISKEEAINVLKQYQSEIEQNSVLLAARKEFAAMSIPALNRVRERVVKNNELKPEYTIAEILSPDRNLVFFISSQYWGKGNHYRVETGYPSVVYIVRPDSQDVKQLLARIGAHELYLHSIQDIAIRSGREYTGRDGDIVHAAMGYGEAVSLLSMGFDHDINPRLIEAARAMERNGMSRNDVLRYWFRIGFGLTDDLPMITAAYENGKLNNGPSLLDLLIGREPPRELITNQTMAEYLNSVARFSGLQFTAIPKPPYHDPYLWSDYIPETSCDQNACPDIKKGVNLLMGIGNSSERKNDPNFQVAVDMISQYSNAKGYDHLEVYGFAKDFYRAWNSLGRPKVINKIILETIHKKISSPRLK